MKIKLLIIFAAVLLLLSGCDRLAGLYPVEGPLAQSGQDGKIAVTFSSIGFGSQGKIEATLADGEICGGEYTILPAGRTAEIFSFSLYAKYFGSGLAPQEARYGQALFTGDKGTVFKAEFYLVRGVKQGYGLARDNKGNLYKLIW